MLLFIFGLRTIRMYVQTRIIIKFKYWIAPCLPVAMSAANVRNFSLPTSNHIFERIYPTNVGNY